MRLDTAACLFILSIGTAFAARKPNIVIVLADDQGWGDLSIHGNTNLRTPNIDSLAKDGALFERFYVSPVCSPTRGGLLTGRYPARLGITGTSKGLERLPLDEVTLGNVFKKAGYATGAFGKWHNGSQYPYHPNGRGFDEFYGFCCGHWSNYFNTTLEHNGRRVKSNGFIIEDLTDKAIAFITKNRDKPFLCYIPYNTPHSPFQVPEKFYAKFKDHEIPLRNPVKKEELATTRAALAMCENIDWNVGRILKTLDELKLRDDTIVIYLSDNGPNSWRWNDWMKGKKGSTDEGGIRVPFLVRWPGQIKAGIRVPHIAAHIDILPTLVDLADLPKPETKPLDGVSLAALLRGKTTEWPERTLFCRWGGNRMTARTQRYRFDGKQLFDMVKDPGQKTNVAKSNPVIAGKMADELKVWKNGLKPPKSSNVIPVGFKEFPLTVIPAQECTFHGKGLSFSSRHPNCSWVTNWTRTDQYVSWPVNISSAGRYAVELLYTCPESSVGTELELELSGVKLAGKVAKAFNPELMPSPDYVKRGESHEKEFATLVLGTIELRAGAGDLILKATSKAGPQIVDLKEVSLRLLP